jgi:hypothetical protein
MHPLCYALRRSILMLTVTSICSPVTSQRSTNLNITVHSQYLTKIIPLKNPNKERMFWYPGFKIWKVWGELWENERGSGSAMLVMGPDSGPVLKGLKKTRKNFSQHDSLGDEFSIMYHHFKYTSNLLCRIWGSHSGGYEEFYFLVYNVM